MYVASSVVATNGFVTAGSSAAAGVVGVSTMEVSDLNTDCPVSYTHLTLPTIYSV